MDLNYYNKQLEAMKQEANSWNSAWKDIKDYICPARGFFSEQPNQGKSYDHKKIIDSSHIRYLRTLASGMTSGLTSPSRPWFKLVLSDEDLMLYQPVAIWLATIQDRMFTLFAKSNIYSSLYNVYEEVGSFGTACLGVFDDEMQMLRGRNFTCGEYFLTVNNRGMVEGFGREYWKTVDQMVAEFGYENCSRSVRSRFDNKDYGSWQKVGHIIEVNRERDVLRLDSRNKPYKSCYWELDSGADLPLHESGFDEFPILGPRWGVATTFDIYGRGPGWDSLGDVKMLQKLQKDKLLGIDKLVNPPIQVDSSVIGEPNLLPGGTTKVSSISPNSGVRSSYMVNIDLNALQMTIKETQDAIAKNYYYDLFMMLANQGGKIMTATEVAERNSERLLMLGSVLERLENELLDPLINRTFNIMIRNGMIPQPPQELQGLDIDVEYISILAQAQKMVGTNSIEQVAGFMGNLSAVKPEVMDNLNVDYSVREYARLVGAPPEMLRSAEEVQMIRDQREQAQQEEKEMQAANLNAQTIATGAKTLSEVKNNNTMDLIRDLELR